MKSFDEMQWEVIGILKQCIRGKVVHGYDKDDLLQEMLLTVMQRWDRYDPQRGSLDHWIRMTARGHLCNLFDKVRKLPRPETDVSEDESTLTSKVQSGGGEPLDAMVNAEMVRTCLDLPSLNTLERNCLRQFYTEGISVADIAIQHGVTQKSVRTAIERAVRKCRKHLEITLSQRTLSPSIARERKREIDRKYRRYVRTPREKEKA